MAKKKKKKGSALAGFLKKGKGKKKAGARKSKKGAPAGARGLLPKKRSNPLA